MNEKLRPLALRLIGKVRFELYLIGLEVRLMLRIPPKHRTDDRRVLEEVIIPYYTGQENCSRILFVGVDWYTAHYHRLVKQNEFWTIDHDPTHRRYGADRHIVDSIENLLDHFPADYLDLIIFNGVFGWGLDTRPACEMAFSACHVALKPGGILIHGWNDRAENRPFHPDQIEAIAEFERQEGAPLNSTRYLAAGPLRHTYDSYRKPR